MTIEDDVPAIIAAMDFGSWNMSQEREFMENLFVGRFNYFLVCFSLFMTAGFANSFTQLKWAVFAAGAWVLFVVWLCLFRAYRKHDRIMKIIFSIKSHPAAQTDAIIRIEDTKRMYGAAWSKRLNEYSSKYRVSWLMGIGIPITCISLQVSAAFATAFGLFG
jgi:hypothetical protein